MRIHNPETKHRRRWSGLPPSRGTPRSTASAASVRPTLIRIKCTYPSLSPSAHDTPLVVLTPFFSLLSPKPPRPGMSYNGYCLYSTFKDPGKPIHPAVRAVVPINTTSRLSTMSYRDGPLHLELIIRWSGYLWTLTRDTTSLLKLVRARAPGLGWVVNVGGVRAPAAGSRWWRAGSRLFTPQPHHIIHSYMYAGPLPPERAAVPRLLRPLRLPRLHPRHPPPPRARDHECGHFYITL